MIREQIEKLRAALDEPSGDLNEPLCYWPKCEWDLKRGHDKTCPFPAARDALAEIEKKMAELEREVEEEIQRRDRYHDAITEAHVALGGDGEWRAHVGRTPPIGESGHLHLDVPVMARNAVRSSRSTALEEAIVAVNELRKSPVGDDYAYRELDDVVDTIQALKEKP